MADDARHAADGADARDEADERDHLADERERMADERDEAADAREQAVDERERRADERERAADARERVADERHRQLGVTVPGTQQRGMEAIARARALLESSTTRLVRSEAALRRDAETQEREQNLIDRETAVSARRWAAARADDSAAAVLLADTIQELRK